MGVGDSMPGKRMAPAGLEDNENVPAIGVDGCMVEGVPTAREAGVDGPLMGVPVAGIIFGVALATQSATLVSSAKSSSSASSVGVGGSFSSTNVGELPAEYVGVGGKGISRPSSRYVGELASGSTLGACPTGRRKALAMAMSCGVAGSAKNSVGEYVGVPGATSPILDNTYPCGVNGALKPRASLCVGVPPASTCEKTSVGE